MSTHREDPWAHDPEVCPAPECPGCHAGAFVPWPRVRLYPDDASPPEGWDDPPYDNGDRADDVEAGRANSSEVAFHAGEGS